VAGSTTLDGISNWGVGDWVAYNGSAWQRVEGGADLNGVNLSVSGTSLLSGNTGVGGDTVGVVAGVTVTSKFCVKQDGTNPVAGFVKAENTTASSGAGTFACRSRGTIAAPTVVQNGDNLWTMFLAGNDGTDLALAAQIQVDVDGTPGSNDMPGRIVFKTTPDGSQSPAEAMKIDSAQNVTVSAGNLVIGTSGKGIDFSATPGTGTSELLADYEEGTWTPEVFDAATGGNQGSGSSAAGNYTKVGNIVTVYCLIASINTTGMTAGNVFYIGGLPFAAKDTSGVNFHGVTDSRNITTTSGGIVASWLIDSQSRVRFFTTTAAGAITAVNVSNVTSGSGTVYLSLTYLAA
jgi:hypothetical protein